MTQQRLFRGPVANMHLALVYVVGEGWHLTVISRRDGEPWVAGGGTSYAHLSTTEMLDCMTAVVEAELQS